MKSQRKPLFFPRVNREQPDRLGPTLYQNPRRPVQRRGPPPGPGPRAPARTAAPARVRSRAPRIEARALSSRKARRPKTQAARQIVDALGRHGEIDPRVLAAERGHCWALRLGLADQPAARPGASRPRRRASRPQGGQFSRRGRRCPRRRRRRSRGEWKTGPASSSATIQKTVTPVRRSPPHSGSTAREPPPVLRQQGEVTLRDPAGARRASGRQKLAVSHGHGQIRLEARRAAAACAGSLRLNRTPVRCP